MCSRVAGGVTRRGAERLTVSPVNHAITGSSRLGRGVSPSGLLLYALAVAVLAVPPVGLFGRAGGLCRCILFRPYRSRGYPLPFPGGVLARPVGVWLPCASRYACGRLTVAVSLWGCPWYPCYIAGLVARADWYGLLSCPAIRAGRWLVLSSTSCGRCPGCPWRGLSRSPCSAGVRVAALSRVDGVSGLGCRACLSQHGGGAVWLSCRPVSRRAITCGAVAEWFKLSALVCPCGRCVRAVLLPGRVSSFDMCCVGGVRPVDGVRVRATD